MNIRCPRCGTNSVVSQDIEALSDSALLVKLQQRIQTTCQNCGWIGFEDPELSVDKDVKEIRNIKLYSIV